MRLMRWLVALIATVAVFALCLWPFRFASWSWLPHATSDLWAVAAAFATVAAGVVGAAGASWASQGTISPGRWINQSARAGKKSRINQVGGDQNITGR